MTFPHIQKKINFLNTEEKGFSIMWFRKQAFQTIPEQNNISRKTASKANRKASPLQVG